MQGEWENDEIKNLMIRAVASTAGKLPYHTFNQNFEFPC
jgi:hypothetical protein